ncbi:T9SS type A sorting domain-containing protein [Wenyingzhuangia sp. IMCC45574]
MRKNTPFFILLLLAITTNAQIAFQGFESSASDTWNYSSNITFYDGAVSSGDFWNIESSANTIIPYEGSNMVATRDLDNGHSQSFFGSNTPANLEHIITFDAVAISGAVNVSFRGYYTGFDTPDYIIWDVAYDNGSDWSSPDYSSTILSNVFSGSLSEWTEFSHEVPSGNSHVRMRLRIYQNGSSDYSGWDNFRVDNSTLSLSKDDTLKFNISPNPTTNFVNIKGDSFINEIIVYNTLGSKVLTKAVKANNTQLSLENLSKGVYYAKVISNNRYNTLKIIKE